MLKFRFFTRVRPFYKDLIGDEEVIPSPVVVFPLVMFLFFSVVKYIFDAASWESHGTSFTDAGVCSSCRWFA